MSETEGNVNGLSTPALADGEFVDAQSEISPEAPEKVTVLEIAANIESKAKALLAQAQKNDEILEQRLAGLTAKVETLRKNLSA